MPGDSQEDNLALCLLGDVRKVHGLAGAKGVGQLCGCWVFSGPEIACFKTGLFQNSHN